VFERVCWIGSDPTTQISLESEACVCIIAKSRIHHQHTRNETTTLAGEVSIAVHGRLQSPIVSASLERSRFRDDDELIDLTPHNTTQQQGEKQTTRQEPAFALLSFINQHHSIIRCHERSC
jgi:hypothetical protein